MCVCVCVCVSRWRVGAFSYEVFLFAVTHFDFAGKCCPRSKMVYLSHKGAKLPPGSPAVAALNPCPTSGRRGIMATTPYHKT